MSTLNIETVEDFDQVISVETKPVIVDFWATWCGPCKRMNPIINELSDKYEGKIVVLKVDVDAVPELAQLFNISSIPTILTFVNGELTSDRIIGAVNSNVLEEHILSTLK